LQIPHFVCKEQIMTTKEYPKHIAIIMDGNGRWAENRQLPRTQGHIEGVKRVDEILDVCLGLKVEVLTVFAFSTENWARPESEVSVLMNILAAVIEKRLKKLKADNVRFQIVGRTDGVPEVVLKSINNAIEGTKDCTGLVFNLAFNYGGRLEITDAVKSIAQDVKDSKISVDQIDEQLISDSLYTKGLPDPDLLIRTSGEQRISNFLLWQLSYAEFYFTNKLWPEFNVEEFNKALAEYQKRDRRFGRVKQVEV